MISPLFRWPNSLCHYNVDLAASGVAYKERMNIPVIAEQVAREQPENLHTYFMERLRYWPALN
ncbi:hypothetical protein KJD99_18540 [Escherichia marmotae]|uniref:DNA polymerase III subunit theta n=1 Tax=Escherichia marmotae TaxID=1499973 RepID=UPI0016503DD9|nr:DNA polymerase III subunit theta [Escherichia marmotae]MDQ9324167.1 hypothetical protein [Escherichia marmotae]MED9671518.1 DNA polymerase III subunit theta [Escherichia marmotae]